MLGKAERMDIRLAPVITITPGKARKSLLRALGTKIARDCRLELANCQRTPPEFETSRNRRTLGSREHCRLKPLDWCRPTEQRKADIGQHIHAQTPECAMGDQ